MKTMTTELTKAMPHRELDLFENIDRMFDNLYRGWLRPFSEFLPEWSPMTGRMEHGMPHVDLIDKEKEFLVRAEVPGVDKKDLKLDLRGDLLTIAGERCVEEKTEEGEVYRAEIARGAFVRTIRLPDAVEPEKVTAEFKNGMLEVHLPKAHIAERHLIEVK